MNESINVRTIQTLPTLKNAFLAFSSETQESLLVLENELHRTLDRLKAEVDLAACRSAVDFAERVLQSAKHRRTKITLRIVARRFMNFRKPDAVYRMHRKN